MILKEKYIKNYWNGKMNVRGKKALLIEGARTYWKVYHLLKNLEKTKYESYLLIDIC